MGKLVLAAKVTHVPSLMLSEVAGSPLSSAQRAFSFPSNVHIYAAKADYDQPLSGKPASAPV